jgi:hypothetical protein
MPRLKVGVLYILYSGCPSCPDLMGVLYILYIFPNLRPRDDRSDWHSLSSSFFAVAERIERLL